MSTQTLVGQSTMLVKCFL